MRKQKTAIEAGALIDDAKKWKSIDWKHARRQVRRLQVRIAKAVKEDRWNKVKALQYLLTRSLYAKLLAVKRVTSNRRYIKIKADANPYLPEYAEYFWYRRNIKGSKLLAAMSARKLRAMNAA